MTNLIFDGNLNKKMFYMYFMTCWIVRSEERPNLIILCNFAYNLTIFETICIILWTTVLWFRVYSVNTTQDARSFCFKILEKY